MSRWLTIAGVVLVLFWAPFLYSELTSEPAEKRDRAGVDEEIDDDEHAELVPIDDGEPADDEPEAPAEEPAEAEGEAEGEAVGEGAAEAEAEAPEMEPAVQQELPTGAAEAEPAEAEAAEDEADDEAGDQPAPPAVLAAGPTAVLKGAFEAEHRDGFWAPDTEARISQLFAKVEAPDGALEAAECRQRVCRVEMAWDQEHATLYTEVYGAIRDEFGIEVGIEPIVAVTPEEGDEDGKHVQKVVMYLPRKGYSVADLSE